MKILPTVSPTPEQLPAAPRLQRETPHAQHITVQEQAPTTEQYGANMERTEWDIVKCARRCAHW